MRTYTIAEIAACIEKFTKLLRVKPKNKKWEELAREFAIENPWIKDYLKDEHLLGMATKPGFEIKFKGKQSQLDTFPMILVFETKTDKGQSPIKLNFRELNDPRGAFIKI